MAAAAFGSPLRSARADPGFDASGWIEEQEDFIISKQVPSGALRGPTQYELQPYFGNWAAQGLAAANSSRSREALGNYIQWFLDHMNTAEEDPYGIPGTVSDWVWDPATGEETDTGEYSSTDAGTTVGMITAHDAFRTGDRDLQHLVMENIEKYEIMASATTEVKWGVRNPDHLCWARPNSKMKYVQDNAVVYRGLNCLAWLERRAHRMEQARYYDRKARQTRSAMLSVLWNEELQNWSWGHGEKLLKVSDLTKAFMPDQWCQYWQVHLQVVSPDDRRSVASWKAYSDACPRWMYNEIDNNFPHTEMALSAVQMGEPENAATLLETCREKFSGNGWALPWYHGEAGHSIRAARALIDTGYAK
ncbi:hypothetical protein [Parenemella sanctibonifatiensis]|uniref:hypothetical protein n=1 Tax=Parenemella sanctibonifatiensis TaxID=2016505 RepID=UPI00118598C3|nr:hypothetical protein [Parenemella sanctibonifatiensis]